MSPIVLLIIMAFISEFIRKSKEENSKAMPRKEGNIDIDLAEELRKNFEKKYRPTLEDNPKPRPRDKKLSSFEEDRREKLYEDDVKENEIRKENIDFQEKPKVNIKTDKHIENKRKSYRKKDLIRGIVFSEILSEPKSIENMRKNM